MGEFSGWKSTEMVKEHSDFAWRTSVRKKKSINDGMETSNSKTDPWDCLVMDRNSHIVQAAILKQDVDGYIIERRKKQKGGSTRGMESYDVSEVRVERGSLLEPTPSNNASIRAELDMAYLMSDAKPSNRRKYFRCIDITANVFLGVDDFECISPLDAMEVGILKGVADFEVRYDLFDDKDLLQFIYILRLQDLVAVEIMDTSCPGRTKVVMGRVEFLGEPSPGKGMKYGILLEDGEEGDMNGMIEGRRLFHAPDRGAVLVGAERLKRPTPQMLDRFNHDSSFYVTSPADFDDSPPNSYRSGGQGWREAPPASSGTYVTADRSERVRNVPITILPTSNSAELNKSIFSQASKSGKSGKSSSPPSSKNSLKKSIGNLIPGRRKSPTSRPTPIQRDYYDGNFDGLLRPASPCHSNSTQSSSSVHYDVPPLEEEHNTFYMAKNGRKIPYSTTTRTMSPPQRRYNNVGPPDTIVYEEKVPDGKIADHTRKVLNYEVYQGAPREGDRIIWLDGKGNRHAGLVKWIGRLKGYANIYYGVEFDDTRAGGGNGYLRGEHLFDAKMDHAAFLPHSMCLLEKNFDVEMQLHAFEATYANKNNHQRMAPPNYSSAVAQSFEQEPPQAPPAMEPARQAAPPSYSTAMAQGFPSIQSSYAAQGKPQPPPQQQKPRLVDKGTRVVTNAYSPPGSGPGRKSPAIEYRSVSEHELQGECGDIVVNSCVKVTHKGDERYGAVAWIGESFEKTTQRVQRVAIVILDSDPPLNWERVVDHLDEMPSMNPSIQSSIFKSSNLSAIVPISALRTDARFALPASHSNGTLSYRQAAASKGSSSSESYLAPPNFGSVDSGTENKCGPCRDITALHGQMKGIQGYCNSCYLDATLYAMFVQSTEFDYILERHRKSSDIPEYDELLKILTTEIVYPLRKFHYVRADHVLKFRQLLSKLLPDMNGLTCDEKDPEEILNVLFKDLLKVKPMQWFRNIVDDTTHESFLCTLIAEDVWSSEQLQLITLQYLIERSMHSSNVMFEELPKTLILQLPRSGQQKLFDKIVPNLELDLTHLLHGGQRPCRTCSSLAEVWCPECFLTNPVLLNEVTFCNRCFHKAHLDKEEHCPKELQPRSARKGGDRGPVKEQFLQLSAVLSINTSHYVSFVRTYNNSWLFFDSMADRCGLSDGYNLPHVTVCDSISQWLSPLGVQRLNEAMRTEGRLPLEVQSDPMVNRLLTDCYICFYTLVGPGSPNTRRIGGSKFFA